MDLPGPLLPPHGQGGGGTGVQMAELVIPAGHSTSHSRCLIGTCVLDTGHLS